MGLKNRYGVERVLDKIYESIQSFIIGLIFLSIGIIKNLPAAVIFTLPFYLFFWMKKQRRPFYSLLMSIVVILTITDLLRYIFYIYTEPTEYDFRYDPKGEPYGDNVDWDSYKVEKLEWQLDYGCWCNNIFLTTPDPEKPIVKEVIYFGDEVRILGAGEFSCWFTFWWGCGILILLLLYYFVKGKLFKPKET